MNTKLTIALNIVIGLLAAYINMWSPGESLVLQKVFALSSDVGHEIALLFHAPKYAGALISLCSLGLAVVHFKAEAVSAVLRVANLVVNVLGAFTIVFLGFM